LSSQEAARGPGLADLPLGSPARSEPTAAVPRDQVPAGAADAASDATERRPLAWERWLRRELLFVVGAAGVLVLDQVTKALAVAYLRPGASLPLTGWLQLTYVENRGAAFGLLQDQTALFILVGLIVVGGLIASYRHLPTVSPLLNLGLGLQLGGALGNLIDRVRQGYVVDFVDLSWWPVFNVADAAIVVGVGVLAYYWASAPQSAEPARSGS
jgi:signal peptidase II